MRQRPSRRKPSTQKSYSSRSPAGWILGQKRLFPHQPPLLWYGYDRPLIWGVCCCSEAWRYTGPFTRWNRFKGLFPGLGIATVAFAGYCVYEQLFLKDDHHHAEDHH